MAVHTRRSATGPALAGTAAAIAGFAGWYATLGDAWLRATGAIAWAGCAVAIALTALALRRGLRGRLAKVAAGATVLMCLAFGAWMLWLSRLPATASFDALERAPAFTLPDHTGAPVSLADEVQRGPVLLVFFRGHW